MMKQTDLDAIAREQKAAQDQCQQIEPFTAGFENFSNTEAYAVANLIHEMRVNEGALPMGRKIGFTNPNIWPTYGVYEPIWGHVYDTTLIKASGPEVACKIGRFAEPRIEPEVVVHFRSAPPATDDLTEILACIDWIAHGIEIVQSHFSGWKFQAADTIADSGLHGALIVGEPRQVNELAPTLMTDLERFTVTLSCNGDVREQGKGSNALGGPLQAVAHLISTIAKQPHPSPLQAGELVTTGTLTAAFPIEASQTWTTQLGGISLPGLSISFED
jgi:2-oxo-3-hexenedioate decarboxylase